MQDVCREAGLSPGAVYCWFPSKEAIIEEVAAERHAREHELIESALASADPRTALRSFFDTYFDWLADPAEQQRRRAGVQVWAESLVNDRLRPTVEPGIGQRTTALDFIRGAQAAGVFAVHVDPDAFTRVVLAIIQGFILQQAWEPDLDVDGYRRAVGFLVDAITDEPPDAASLQRRPASGRRSPQETGA